MNCILEVIFISFYFIGRHGEIGQKYWENSEVRREHSLEDTQRKEALVAENEIEDSSFNEGSNPLTFQDPNKIKSFQGEGETKGAVVFGEMRKQTDGFSLQRQDQETIKNGGVEYENGVDGGKKV